MTPEAVCHTAHTGPARVHVGRGDRLPVGHPAVGASPGMFTIAGDPPAEHQITPADGGSTEEES